MFVCSGPSRDPQVQQLVTTLLQTHNPAARKTLTELETGHTTHTHTRTGTPALYMDTTPTRTSL